MTLTDIGVRRRGNGHAPAGAFERLGRYVRQPQLTIPRPGKPPARIVVDRVRARPAVTPTLAGAMGLMGLGLGVTQLIAPHAFARFFGLPAAAATGIRACGVREVVTGLGLVSDPTQAGWLWARTAGDALDYAGLRVAAGPHNPHADRVRAALGIVALIGVADAVLAGRMSTVKRNCREARR